MSFNIDPSSVDLYRYVFDRHVSIVGFLACPPHARAMSYVRRSERGVAKPMLSRIGPSPLLDQSARQTALFARPSLRLKNPGDHCTVMFTNT